MHDEITSSYKTCKDLQNLINITFFDVIKPLREAFRNNPKSKIIELEIKDAENKVFEYISSQITTIGNASEEDSTVCLKEFPKSDICYRCIGLDDDTIQGLLKIRNISFLCFLEMESVEVIKLMEIYCVNKSEISSITISLNIIKQNIDLLYSNSALIDNTRNLIKLVIRLVENKSTVDDIGIIGIPSWLDATCHEKSKQNNENVDEHSLSNGNFVDVCFYNENQQSSKCLSNMNHNNEHKRSVSDCHPSSIISTKKPINQETLLKAFKSNTTLSGITCNDDKSYLSTNQLTDLNSLSVPNTPNVQKSRSVGGSEEILTDIDNPIINCSTELNISPPIFRKNYSRMAGKLKSSENRNIQLQRSLSHEFDSTNLLNLKDNDSSPSNQFQNQQFQPSVFQFSSEKLSVGNFNTIEKERRASCEEKLIHKSSTLSCDFNAIIRPLSPGFPSKKWNEVNNGLKVQGYFHKFESEAKFNIPNIVKPPICTVCQTKKFLLKFMYCETCKIKVHKGCIHGAGQIPCIKYMKSPPLDRKNSDNSVTHPVCQGSDSNSNSTPESPLNVENNYNSVSGNNHISPRYPNKLLKNQNFDFSKVQDIDSQDPSKVKGACKDIVIIDNDSKTPETTNKLNQRFESTESQDESSHLSRANSISVALKEWEIPYKNLELGELLGKGSFWTVFKGKWHGEVAVKIMNIDSQDENDACMAAFKSEVGALHKTRHENLVLFMGACMEPPKLAIVTQLSQGETLFYQLHLRHVSVPIIRAINIASQVAKGMGYLHAKDILHKDLKSRNIFIESNCKVVISDFGLFDFVRMCKQAISGSYLRIPQGWLCYLAPELIRKLNLNSIFSNNSSEDLPFTKSSDIYAFGTIWYEILNSKWPFEGLPSEAIIYRVGKGIKESLKVVHAKEFKDLLIHCWSSKPENRPAFTNIVQILEKLPKLQRSPSYPVKSINVVRSHDNLIT